MKTKKLDIKLLELQKRISIHADIILNYIESFSLLDKKNIGTDIMKDVDKLKSSTEILKNKTTLLSDFTINNQNITALPAIRHDIRSPINGIKGYTEIILEGLAESHQTHLMGNFALILEISKQILLLVEDIREEISAETDILKTDITKQDELKLTPTEIKNDEDKKEQENEINPKNPKRIFENGYVLIVDDNEDDIKRLSSWLTTKGYKTISATNGASALQIVHKNENIEIILLDLAMPKISGYDVLKQIKSQKEHFDIPVIMISAMDEIENITKCIRAGAEDYLLKPFNAYLLAARIDACIEKRKLRDSYIQRHLGTTLNKSAMEKAMLLKIDERKSSLILVVDDLATNRDLLQNWLTKKNHRVLTAEDGYQALQLLEQHDNIDVILLDLMMPGMDGHMVLQRIKTAKAYMDIPVIMISASNEMEGIVDCIKNGAEDYLTKPFNSFLLDARINACIEKKQLRDQENAYMLRIADEMDVAQHIQLSMLPAYFPQSDIFNVYAHSVPAKEVGGDFYDCYLIDDNKIGFCIGDVSGKGIPAALFMAISRTVLYTLVTQLKIPTRYIEHANSILIKDNDAMMFITLFYGILDTNTRELTYVNSGHLPAIILHDNNEIEFLDQSSGPALGVIEEIEYKPYKISIQPNDLIFLYTDGITEAFDKLSIPFGTERLIQTLKKNKNLEPQKLVQTIIQTVKDYSGNQEQTDDITCLALSFKGLAINQDT